MNSFHRFLATGFLTALSVLYVGSAMAEQISSGQMPPQPYYDPSQPYVQQPRPKTYGQIIGAKAANGAINASPASLLELPKAIINDINAEDSNFLFGLVGGALEGSLNTAARMSTGLADLITFMVPTKPITQPQYIWDDFDETNTYGDVFRLDSEGNASHFETPGNSNAVKIQRHP